ncbi:glycosyltransferase family 39 protein [Clostridium thailandense]|uniref:glycosyltransferase family 39 protein n=1 Tax=Clostridium thailandense TaxID=2794346 RepID=UPI003989B182
MENKKVRIDTYYKIILIISLCLSIMWILLIRTKPFSDFEYYYNLAIDIANGMPWGDTYTSVGYPIVLGGIFKIFGSSLISAQIFNLILAFISDFSLLMILKKLDISEMQKRVIFTIFAFMPNNIVYNSMIATEVLFTTIILLITNIFLGKGKFKYIWIGILTGLNTMIKPFFIVFFFAIFIVEILKERKLIKPLKNSFIVLVICCIVISPWIYRNTKLMGQFTFVSNNGGIVLYINNNSQNNKGRWMAASDVENSIVKKPEYEKANMTEKNKMLGTAAKKWIRNHPKEFVVLGFKRLYNTYLWGDDVLYSTYGSNLSENVKEIIFTVSNDIRSILFVPAIIYILVYSFLILKAIIFGATNQLNRFTLYTVIVFFMFTSVYFVTEGQGRYAFPEIFIMIYCFSQFIKTSILKIKELFL